jgi:hypothetical protein
MGDPIRWIQRQIDDLYERIQNIPRNISSLITDLRGKVRNIFTELDYLWGEIYELYDDVRDDIRDQILDMRIWVTEKVEEPIYEYIFMKVGDIRDELQVLGQFLESYVEGLVDVLPTWDDVERMIDSSYSWFEEKIILKTEKAFWSILQVAINQEKK